MNYTIGIIGLGKFGLFLGSLLAEENRVVGYDKFGAQSQVIELADFAAVARADVVVVAIPLEAYPDVLGRLEPLLPRESLLMDVCSVKLLPQQMIREHLPNHDNLLLIHPMFGPRTAPDKQREVLVTLSQGKRADRILEYFHNKLGFSINSITADAHDRAMAQVHALTFFIARGLGRMEDIDIGTQLPGHSYQLLESLLLFDSSNSKDLFDTIERGNPYAAEARADLLKKLTEIDKELTT